MQNTKRNCRQCGAPFTPKRKTARYCSKSCQRKFLLKRFRHDHPNYQKEHYVQRGPYPKTCEHCQKSFNAKRKDARFCSAECQFTARNKRAAEQRKPYGNLPPSIVGAIQELKVCADLLAKGYHVFRSVSPTASCDISVLRGKELLRIEVRTAFKSRNGAIQYNRKISDKGKQDIFALVLNGNEIIYKPPLPK